MGGKIHTEQAPSHGSGKTYRAWLVTEISLPSRRAKAKSIHGVASCSIGTVACLVAVETPSAAWAWDGTIYSLPP